MYEPTFKTKVFTEEDEAAMVSYLQISSKMNYGLTPQDARGLAYDTEKAKGLKIHESWDRDQKADRDWISAFVNQHPISLRKPEGCSLARNTAFNRENVATFFTNLKEIYLKYPSLVDGTRVYNLDETGVTTAATPPRVLAATGQRQVAQVQTAERGTMVTVCSIVSAAGTALPPAMIFPRKNFVDRMVNGAPPGTLGLAAQSPWMTGELFFQVLDHFITVTGSTKDNPTLLIMDNHRSHLAVNVLSLAKENGVIILTLPPHCTHKLQPLDVGVFGPFMVHYNQAISHFHLNNPGTKIDIYNIGAFVGIAHQKSMSIENIRNAFAKVGIVPFNDDVFTEAEFLACLPEEPVSQASCTDTANMNNRSTSSASHPTNSSSAVHETTPTTSASPSPTPSTSSVLDTTPSTSTAPEPSAPISSVPDPGSTDSIPSALQAAEAVRSEIRRQTPAESKTTKDKITPELIRPLPKSKIPSGEKLASRRSKMTSQVSYIKLLRYSSALVGLCSIYHLLVGGQTDFPHLGFKTRCISDIPLQLI